MNREALVKAACVEKSLRVHTMVAATGNTDVRSLLHVHPPSESKSKPSATKRVHGGALPTRFLVGRIAAFGSQVFLT